MTNKDVSDELVNIAKDDLLEQSGYPYPADTKVPSAKAFAYGLAVGAILKEAKDWQEKDESQGNTP